MKQTEFAVLYGAGLDYRFLSNIRRFKESDLVPHLALRFQYRGLFYRAPSFKNPTLFTGRQGHLAEAAGGLVIKF